MGWRSIAVGMMVGLMPVGAAVAQAPVPLRLYTEDYPPVTFERDGRAEGLGTEIVREILRRLEISAPIEVLPWARAYTHAVQEPNVGLFVTTRTPGREPLFKWVGPVTATHAMLYSRAGDGGTITSMADARKVEGIAVPRQWYLHQQLLADGFTNLVEVATPGDAIRLLAGGRVRLMALDDMTLRASLAGIGEDISHFAEILPLSQAVQYIVFSRRTDEAVVAPWRQALAAMKADGTFAALYHHWLPGARLPDG